MVLSSGRLVQLISPPIDSLWWPHCELLLVAVWGGRCPTAADDSIADLLTCRCKRPWLPHCNSAATTRDQHLSKPVVVYSSVVRSYITDWSTLPVCEGAGSLHCDSRHCNVSLLIQVIFHLSSWLKCLKNCGMDCHETGSRHLFLPQEKI